MKRHVLLFLTVCTLLGLLLLSGCGKKAVKPPPTVVNIEIRTSAQLNPDAAGRPSPVTLRIYGLTSLGNFNAVDFFTLYDNEQAALGKTMTLSEELHLKPDSKKIYTHELPPGTLYLGVMAAFRDIETALWRDSVAVPVARTTNFVVQLDGNRIAIHVE